MMRKFGIILLTIAFLLSAFSLLPVKQVSANTGPDIALCAAEPWHWLSHSGKGGSGTSGGDNQEISNPANHSVTKHPLSNSTQPTSYQEEHGSIIRQRDQPPNWWVKFLLFWQIVSNK